MPQRLPRGVRIEMAPLDTASSRPARHHRDGALNVNQRAGDTNYGDQILKSQRGVQRC